MTGSKSGEGFSFGQVARFSGIKPRTLDHWAATGFLDASSNKIRETVHPPSSGPARFLDAGHVKELRLAGASLQGLRKVVKTLRTSEFAKNLGEMQLVVSGKDVYLQDHHDLISMLSHPGPIHFPFTVLDLGATIRALRSKAEKVEAA